jgi:hypothetical protein
VLNVGQGRSLFNRLPRQGSGEMVKWSRVDFKLAAFFHTDEESDETCLRDSSARPTEYGSGRYRGTGKLVLPAVCGSSLRNA